MPETQLNQPLKKGDHSGDVKIVQEWLTFHGFGTAVDSEFGPATELCVRNFQTKYSLLSTGIVDMQTFSPLVSPLVTVQKRITPAADGLGALFVKYAQQHLMQKPLEIGGENCGPWVRLYMAGNEGAQWPWCAGFATWVLRQAAQTLGVMAPHPYAFGCDYLGGKAESAG